MLLPIGCKIVFLSSVSRSPILTLVLDRLHSSYMELPRKYVLIPPHLLSRHNSDFFQAYTIFILQLAISPCLRQFRQTQIREMLTHQLFILFMLAIICQAASQTFNAITTPILDSDLEVHVQKYASIPDYEGSGSRIVGIVRQSKALYITTSVSGGLIYRISPKGRVIKWFDVDAAIRSSTGRSIAFSNIVHGGLRGLAFHPKYRRNGLFYVSLMETRGGQPPSDFTYFSPPAPDAGSGDSVVIEFRANTTTRKPIINSYRQVLRVSVPKFDHPIKQIAFCGKFLYITHGDGSEQSAVGGGGQNNDAFGKILRINPLQKGNRPYTVPMSNPFTNNPNFRNEIYARGFRNPHNLCFSKSGELFLVDAGRDNVEEVNLVKPGGNYGWSLREGAFTALPDFGIGMGISPLPADDARFGFEYPVAVVGHEGTIGDFLNGQALAGGCPIENNSPLRGIMLYANFPTEGNLYFSRLNQMRNAVTQGNPGDLRPARTFRPKIFFDHDNDASTAPIQVANLREIMRMDPGHERGTRVNLRFGQGRRGEIYWSSKGNGRIYLITSSLPGATV